MAEAIYGVVGIGVVLGLNLATFGPSPFLAVLALWGAVVFYCTIVRRVEVTASTVRSSAGGWLPWLSSVERSEVRLVGYSRLQFTGWLGLADGKSRPLPMFSKRIPTVLAAALGVPLNATMMPPLTGVRP